MIRAALLAPALALLAASPALSAEPQGCGALRWNLDRERAALQAPAVGAASGTSAVPGPTAVRLALALQGQAALPKPPERQPRAHTPHAAYLTMAAPAAGLYQVTLSAPAWIDLVQVGAALKPVAFTGANGCPGVRKSVRFRLKAEPFTLEVSDVSADTIAVVVEAAPDAN